MSNVRSLLALAVIVSAAGAHAAEPTRIIPAMSAIQAGKSFVLWAPDLRSVLGFDADGNRTWRVATGDQGGLRELARLAGNVLIYAGEEAILVAPDSGKVLGKKPYVTLGAPGGPRGCRISEHEGACALTCECRFEVVRCEDLKTLGEPARLPRFAPIGQPGSATPSLGEESDEEGHMQSHCPMFSGGLIGRAGDAVITSFPAATDKPFFSVPEIVVARHAKTGAELWRSSGIGFFDEDLSGVANDGKCFAGSRAGSLRIFDCQRGTLAWGAPIKVVASADPQVESTTHGVAIREGLSVSLHDTLTGHSSWKVEVPADRLVIFEGTPAPTEWPTFDRALGKKVIAARILRPVDGLTLGEIRFGRGADRWPRRFGAGWVTLTDGRIETWDMTGRSTGTYDADGPVVGFGGALGPGRLAVLIDGKGPWDAKNPETFGELRLFRLKP